MAEFKLPDLGEGVTEAEVDRWLVKEGDVIGEDDPLVEVITDKATAEIPSPYAGTVARIHVEAGAVVPVGTVLVTIGEAGADNVEVPDVQEDPIQKAFTRAPAGGESVPESNGQAIKAMPPVRKLARSLGIDLGGVRGTGPEGRILRTDVEAHATGSGAPVEAEPGRAGTGERREPLRGVRRIVAERMSEAHRIVPPVTHVEECDVTELDATRRLANERSPELQKLTFM
ncbi:MAG: hypothetical protein QOF16_57, partial [Actinomycetota bacterium]|nr:hypothetical protein [Actinomycetota bacterium]